MRLSPPAGMSLGRVLDAGGRSAVFEVVGADGIVAVCKRLGPRVRGEPAAQEALRREAAILRALDGRGAPRLLGAGEDDGGPFVVMRRATGAPLGERTGLGPHLEDLLRATFAALAEVHEAHDDGGPLGAVHGDLSPANVVHDPGTGQATLIDFGAGAMRGLPPPEARLAATLAYVAPEQARGGGPSAAADVFAMAASLLSLAAGRPARAAATPAALLLAAAEQPLDELVALARARGAGAWVARLAPCVAMDPSARPAARDVLRE